jgi:hypothetical protein
MITTRCPTCRKSMDIHADADCLQRQAQRAEVARVILRNTMAVPFREEISRMGKRVSVAISLTDSQYQALKQFAEDQ